MTEARRSQMCSVMRQKYRKALVKETGKESKMSGCTEELLALQVFFFLLLTGVDGSSFCRTSLWGMNRQWCAYGCCGTFKTECCSQNVALVAGLAVLGFLAAAVTIGVICCCMRRRGARGSVLTTQPQHPPGAMVSTQMGPAGMVTITGPNTVAYNTAVYPPGAYPPAYPPGGPYQPPIAYGVVTPPPYTPGQYYDATTQKAPVPPGPQHPAAGHNNPDPGNQYTPAYHFGSGGNDNAISTGNQYSPAQDSATGGHDNTAFTSSDPN